MNKYNISNIEFYNQKKQSGFTLIEVLVALVIVAVALLAILKATSMAIKNSDYLEQKTCALWVAYDAISSIQLGLQSLPSSNVAMTMLHQTWYWSADETSSGISGSNKITIIVRRTPQSAPIIQMQAYKFMSS